MAGVVAILFGLCPKFGALVAATPGGVLGGITVVLYGMIGLLGAKIWIENRVDFANPINLVPIGAGIILAIGPVAHQITDDFTLEGIALGTVVLLAGYHLVYALAPAYMREALHSPAGFDEGAASRSATRRAPRPLRTTPPAAAPRRDGATTGSHSLTRRRDGHAEHAPAWPTVLRGSVG